MDLRMRYGTILLTALIAVLFAYGLFFRSCASDPTISKADLTVTASGLTRAFDENEAHSDSLFLHKSLSVSGVIRTVGPDASGGYIATMGGHSPDGTEVNCRLDSRDNSRYATLKAGDSLRVVGICAGRLGDVILIQCIIDK
jgi:hypothetical protein